MIHTDERFSSMVEEAVTRLEQATDAEVVVIAAARSGSYRDVAANGASFVALITLIVIMALPFPVHPILIVIDLIAVWWLSRWLLNGPLSLRRLVPLKRQVAQVEEAAHAEFHREAVHATPRRTGLLIYISALEGRVELLPDDGLARRIPRGLWADAVEAFSHDDLDHFLQGLREVGALLAEHIPPTEGESVDLPNAPRIRS